MFIDLCRMTMTEMLSVTVAWMQLFHAIVVSDLNVYCHVPSVVSGRSDNQFCHLDLRKSILIRLDDYVW